MPFFRSILFKIQVAHGLLTPDFNMCILNHVRSGLASASQINNKAIIIYRHLLEASSQVSSGKSESV